MKVKPLGDRVLIKPLEDEEQKYGSIIIPDTAKEKPQQGIVVAVGAGLRKDDGSFTPLTVKENDKVIYSKYGGTEIKVDNETHLIMTENDILGILE